MPADAVQPISSQTAHREIPTVPEGAEIGFATPKRPEGMRARPTECLNCGHKPLFANFCPDCGQENLNYAIPLHLLLGDLFEEFLKWDGRLLRTVGMLLFRPGRLTAEYNAGRRVRYMSPFKLYLGITTLFFLVLFVPPTLVSLRQRLQDQPGASQGKPSAEDNRPGIRFSIGADLEKSLNTPPSASPPAPKPPPSPGKAVRKAGSVTSANVISVPEPPAKDTKQTEEFEVFGKTDLFTPYPLRDGRKILQGHFVEEYDRWQQDKRNTSPHNGLPRLLIEQTLKCIDNPEHFSQELVESAAKAMFFMMPIYALLVGMLFRTPRKYFVEHLVFAVNHHSFVFFLGTLVAISAETRNDWGWFLLPLYYVYEFIALRTCYRQGKRMTLFKQFVLNQIYFFIVLVGLVITALVTVAFL
ncbi:MAG: DUF3667 domain-containing protein [Capsulimonadales bacterium]|nr:DUF3667 domain-containing protein [Capsulimonadales bacterium]